MVLLENSLSVDSGQIMLFQPYPNYFWFSNIQSSVFCTSIHSVWWTLPLIFPFTSSYLSPMPQLVSLSPGNLPNQRLQWRFLAFPQHKICYFHDFYDMVLAFAGFWHHTLECEMCEDRILLTPEVLELLCPVELPLGTCGDWEIGMWLEQVKVL